ncbi:hypothetical protein ROZALSC1DRAFT_30762, partial [Rozella allomycis CSF55]
MHLSDLIADIAASMNSLIEICNNERHVMDSFGKDVIVPYESGGAVESQQADILDEITKFEKATLMIPVLKSCLDQTDDYEIKLLYENEENLKIALLEEAEIYLLEEKVTSNVYSEAIFAFLNLNETNYLESCLSHKIENIKNQQIVTLQEMINLLEMDEIYHNVSKFKIDLHDFKMDVWMDSFTKAVKEKVKRFVSSQLNFQSILQIKSEINLLRLNLTKFVLELCESQLNDIVNKKWILCFKQLKEKVLKTSTDAVETFELQSMRPEELKKSLVASFELNALNFLRDIKDQTTDSSLNVIKSLKYLIELYQTMTKGMDN